MEQLVTVVIGEDHLVVTGGSRPGSGPIPARGCGWCRWRAAIAVVAICLPRRAAMAA